MWGKEKTQTSKIYPIILSGGAGSRLWPLSRELYPKQLLALISDKTMIQETALRVSSDVSDLFQFAPPLIICNEEHRFIIAEQMREAKIKPLCIMLEPVGRNTAPAIALAAHYLKALDPKGVMLVLPADHHISDQKSFMKAVEEACPIASDDHLVTFGMKPTFAHTGYGYIETGSAFKKSNHIFNIKKFTEKPDQKTAEDFIKAKSYLWNSGMFMFTVETYLNQLKKYEKEIYNATEKSVKDGQNDLDFIRVGVQAFKKSPSNSIDYAIMEKTSKGAVIACDFGWTDIGSWASLWDFKEKDKKGNFTFGHVELHKTKNSYIHSDGALVATNGLEDMVVIAMNDVVMVSKKDEAENIKEVVERLKKEQKEEVTSHKRVYRPWGFYEQVSFGDRFQVKRIQVKPKAVLSLQKHHHRAEHWIVVNGTALVTRDEETFLLSENESTYIPLGAVHRLENPGKVPLNLIEVQSGTYLGEDDIVRMEDVYGRVPE